MAFELRCPDCGSKLRLAEAPEAGTEIECPKCTHVFTAPRNDDDGEQAPAFAGAAAKKKKKRLFDDADDAPQDKKRSDGDDAPPVKADGEKAKKKKKKDDKKNQPKKRRAKKKETNPLVLVFISVGALMVLGIVITALVVFYGRKSPSEEMMAYLPNDTHSVSGLNYGHTAKYPEFFKVAVTPTVQDRNFKHAADALAKALKVETDDMLDYMVTGETRHGDVIVLRTKTDFDTTALSKLPGAKKGNADFYTVADIPNAPSLANCRVFAPTPRIVVFSASTIPDATFRSMMSPDPKAEKSILVRMGPLGKEVSRGTWWGFRLVDGNLNKPTAPLNPEQAGAAGGAITNDNDRAVKQLAFDSAGKAKGYGFKIALQSKTAKFTAVIWYNDEDSSKALYDKFKDSDLVKASDDASLDPPRWWKGFMQGFGDRRVGNNLMTNIGARKRGELFIVYSEVDTKDVMPGVASIVNKIIPPPPPPGQQ